MDAAHHNRDAALTELRGDLIGARRLRGERRQADQIRLHVSIIEGAVHLLVDQFDVPMGRCRGGDVAERQRLPEVIAVE